MAGTIDDDNKYNSNAIDVLFPIDEKKMKKRNVIKVQLVGHVAEPLAKILYPMMKKWCILSMRAIITGEKRRAPGGTWVPGGGTELPCLHHIYAAKAHKRYARENLENEEKNNILSET